MSYVLLEQACSENYLQCITFLPPFTFEKDLNSFHISKGNNRLWQVSLTTCKHSDGHGIASRFRTKSM